MDPSSTASQAASGAQADSKTASPAGKHTEFSSSVTYQIAIIAAAALLIFSAALP